jgi:hypothetical protein
VQIRWPREIVQRIDPGSDKIMKVEKPQAGKSTAFDDREHLVGLHFDQ